MTLLPALIRHSSVSAAVALTRQVALLMGAALVVFAVGAAEYSVEPTLTTTLEVNSNKQVAPNGGDVLAGILLEGGARFGVETDRYRAGLTPTFIFERFPHRRQEDRLDPTIALDSLIRLSPRNTFSLNGSYRREESRTVDLVDTGTVTVEAVGRRTFRLQPIWQHALSPRTTLSLTLSGTSSDYEESLVPNTVNGVFGDIRRLANRQSLITLEGQSPQDFVVIGPPNTCIPNNSGQCDVGNTLQELVGTFQQAEIRRRDFLFYSATVGGEHRLSERTTLLADMTVSQFDPLGTARETLSFSGRAGLEIQMAETLKGTFRSGWQTSRAVNQDRVSETEVVFNGLVVPAIRFQFDADRRETSTGLLFDTSLEKTFSRGLTTLAYSRSLFPTGDGFLVQRDTLNAAARYRATETVTAYVRASRRKNEPLGNGPDSVKSELVIITVGLRRRLNPRWSVSADYRYLYRDRPASNITASTGAFLLSLEYTGKKRTVSR